MLLRRTTASLVAVAMLSGAVGCSTDSDVRSRRSTASTGSTPVPDDDAKVQPSVAPAPPVQPPLDLGGGDPAVRAASASAAFGDPLTRMPAVVAALGASGVPVLDPRGVPIPGTGSDEIGMPWVHVSTVAATAVGASVALTDVVLIATVGEDARPDPATGAPGSVAAATLDGLRAGLTSSDPEVQFFSSLIRESSLRLGGADLSDPVTTAGQVLLDAATTEVFAGRLWRSLVLDLASTGDLEQAPAEFRSVAAVPAPAAPSIDCSSDGMAGWGFWVASKATGGIDLEKLGLGKFDGILVETIKKARLVGEASGELLKTVSKLMEVAGYFSGGMSFLNLLYLKMSLTATATMDPGKITRNKKRSDGDGNEATVTFTISIKPPVNSDAMTVINCLSALAAGLGNNTTFPPDGPVEGVEVTIVGGKGFTSANITSGTLVLFGGKDRGTVDLKPTTGPDGTVRVPVMGRAPEKDYPSNAEEVEKSFSIHVSATPEPVDGSTIAKTFFDSLVCVAKPGPGCGDIASDLSKVLSWNLGEFSFPLIDWEGASYRITGGLEDFQVDQVVCDITKQFLLFSEIGTMTLSGGLSGTYTFSGMFNATYTGTYQFSFPDGPDKPGTLVGTGSGSIAGQAGSGTETYTVTPDTTGC